METRAAKRRADASALAHNRSPKRKRVVLGELPILPNLKHSLHDNPHKQPKPQRNTRAKKPKTTTNSSFSSENPKSDEGSEPYVSDIYHYLRKMEAEPKRRPLSGYIEKIQKDVSANMRGILVDWLVEVAEEYKLLTDTLYLSVSYIDRFLSTNKVTRHKLQLVGVASMFIASKYEEINPPHVEEFCYITDNTYLKAEVVEMEAAILKTLNFEMGNPTVKTFLRKFTCIASENQDPHLQFEFLCCYLAELSLLDYNCVRFLPSLVAASVIFLANFIIDPKLHPWDSALQKSIGYRPDELKDCVLILLDLYLGRRGGSLQTIREKYRQHKFKYVAMLPCSPEIPISYLKNYYGTCQSK